MVLEISACKMLSLFFYICALVSLSTCTINGKFPLWFKFGSGTSALQVEGAWNVSGRSESKWEHLYKSFPYIVEDLSTPAVACDSYHLWKRDIEMVSELGLQFYRFSISWPRLLPSGFPNIVSEEGKQYYNYLIDGLLAKGIEPVVTIYHFDLPQVFQDLGGWANPSMPDWFVDYARVVFSLFGDRVKTWVTVNEPQMDCDIFYTAALKEINAPEHNVANYLCSKYTLLGHAKAWRLYDQEYKAKYKGKLAPTNHMLWLSPQSPEDENLTEAAREFYFGRFTHPIYSKEGGWPPIVEEMVARTSKRLGYSRSMLPPFTQEEIELIKGTYDFFAMNHYTSRLIRPRLPWENLDENLFLSCVPEIQAVYDVDPKWSPGFNPLFPIHPSGIREQMQWIRQKYGDIGILITENGFPSSSRLDDDNRIEYIKLHLEQILIALSEGINVTGYSYWSLMDDFEYFDGYKSKFGLYEVDFTNEQRKRTPRKSAIYYKNVIHHKSLNLSPEHQAV